MIKKHFLQKYIATKIRYYRKKKKISQEGLSEKAGLGLKYINQIENQNINLSVQTLEKIIAALDLTPEEFFNFNSLEETVDSSDNLAFRRFNMKIKQLPKEKQASFIDIFEKILDQLD